MLALATSSYYPLSVVALDANTTFVLQSSGELTRVDLHNNVCRTLAYKTNFHSLAIRHKSLIAFDDRGCYKLVDGRFREEFTLKDRDQVIRVSSSDGLWLAESKTEETSTQLHFWKQDQWTIGPRVKGAIVDIVPDRSGHMVITRHTDSVAKPGGGCYTLKQGVLSTVTDVASGHYISGAASSAKNAFWVARSWFDGSSSVERLVSGQAIPLLKRAPQQRFRITGSPDGKYAAVLGSETVVVFKGSDKVYEVSIGKSRGLWSFVVPFHNVIWLNGNRFLWCGPSSVELHEIASKSMVCKVDYSKRELRK